MSADQLRSVEVEGRTIAYREDGDGPPLLVLHGFLCDSRCWMPQLMDLSDGFRVVAWDAPGAGSSSDPPDTFTTADYVRSLAGFMDAIGVERAHILGLSWGAILAQEFYRDHAARFLSLVLAGAYAGWRGSLPEEAWKERLETCLEQVDAPAEELVASLVPGMFTDAVPPEVVEEFSAIMREFHPAGFRLMTLSSAEVDTRDLLPDIDVSTLLLWGEEDRRSSLEIAEMFASEIPDAKLAIIPEAGHVSNLERPEAFDAHVRRFCLSA